MNHIEMELRSELDLANKKIKLLEDFAKYCSNNFDCDRDAHRHNTTCITCEAESVIDKVHELKSFAEASKDLEKMIEKLNDFRTELNDCKNEICFEKLFEKYNFSCDAK